MFRNMPQHDMQIARTVVRIQRRAVRSTVEQIATCVCVTSSKE